MSTANFFELFGGPPRTKKQRDRQSKFHLAIVGALSDLRFIYQTLEAMTYEQRERIVLVRGSTCDVKASLAVEKIPAVMEYVGSLDDRFLAVFERYVEPNYPAQVTPAQFEIDRMSLLNLIHEWIVWLRSIDPLCY